VLPLRGTQIAMGQHQEYTTGERNPILAQAVLRDAFGKAKPRRRKDSKNHKEKQEKLCDSLRLCAFVVSLF
jgi:hypothetical protein